MQRVIEVLHRIGIGRERELTLFEQARKVMEEAGGRELILGVAKELRENGDKSAIVEEEKQEKDSSANKLTLRWGIQKSTDLGSARWVSKEACIVARSTGYIFIATSFLPNDDPIPLNEIVKFRHNLSSLITRRYVPPCQSKRNVFRGAIQTGYDICKSYTRLSLWRRSRELKPKTG